MASIFYLTNYEATGLFFFTPIKAKQYKPKHHYKFRKTSLLHYYLSFCGVLLVMTVVVQDIVATKILN